MRKVSNKFDRSGNIVAYLRSIELDVSKDTLAKYFFEPEDVKFANKWLKQFPFVARHIALRGRYIEDSLMKFAKEYNIRQVVNIAAGVNSFPYRHSEANYFKSYIEIDRHNMIEYKKKCIKKIINNGISLSKEPAVNYISLDLLSEDAVKQFSNLPFNQKLPSIYIFEGIACWLEYKNLIELINNISKYMAKKSIFIMDYLPKRTSNNEPSYSEGQAIIDDQGTCTNIKYLSKEKIRSLFGPFYNIISDERIKDLENKYYSSSLEKPSIPNELCSVLIAERI
jgi:methyltransferase (TIGR00027 family)